MNYFIDRQQELFIRDIDYEFADATILQIKNI